MRATHDDILGMVFFARVVEAKSFSAAARSLGLSKSAVSARVARLESNLGLRLLHRTTRRLALTADGVRFYERCARLVAEADQVVEAAAGASAEPRGALRVLASTGLAQPFLATVIGEFVKTYPGVRVELRFADRAPEGAMDPSDVSVVISGKLADSGLVARKLATSRVVVCASPTYLRRKGIPFRPQDLVHHECLLHRGVHTEEWHFQTSEGAVPMSGPPSLVVDDARFLREASLVGLGIAVLPRILVAEDLAERRLLPLLEEFQSFQVSVLALHAHRRLAPASVRAFVDHLVEHFRAPPWEAIVESPAARPAKSRGASIPMTEQDVRRLSAVTRVYASVEENGSRRLEEILGRVKRLAVSEIPRSAVTMNSRVTVHDAGRDRDVSLVYPWDAGGDRISVLSRLGSALLGASVGSALKNDGHPLRIVAIPYQPEAAGDHHL
jgi:DNA-binding transcriptional LysR family regulator